MIFVFSNSFVVIFAHAELIDTEVDECVSSISNGDIDETWYITLKKKTDYFKSYHISEDVVTLRYYFEPYAENHPDFTWEFGVRESFGNLSDYEVNQRIKTIKTNYSDSMKKWNNVYFYSYNLDGTITKNKIINIIEGTVDNHNISIFPTSISIDPDLDFIAITGSDGAYNFREVI